MAVPHSPSPLPVSPPRFNLSTKPRSKLCCCSSSDPPPQSHGESHFLGQQTPASLHCSWRPWRRERFAHSLGLPPRHCRRRRPGQTPLLFHSFVIAQFVNLCWIIGHPISVSWKIPAFCCLHIDCGRNCELLLLSNSDCIIQHVNYLSLSFRVLLYNLFMHFLSSSPGFLFSWSFPSHSLRI